MLFRSSLAIWHPHPQTKQGLALQAQHQNDRKGNHRDLSLSRHCTPQQRLVKWDCARRLNDESRCGQLRDGKMLKYLKSLASLANFAPNINTYHTPALHVCRLPLMCNPRPSQDPSPLPRSVLSGRASVWFRKATTGATSPSIALKYFPQALTLSPSISGTKQEAGCFVAHQRIQRFELTVLVNH